MPVAGGGGGDGFATINAESAEAASMLVIMASLPFASDQQILGGWILANKSPWPGRWRLRGMRSLTAIAWHIVAPGKWGNPMRLSRRCAWAWAAVCLGLSAPAMA